MTPTMKPVNHIQAKWRQFRGSYSAWAVVGVHPDGREESLDIGTREAVQASYRLLFNCPTYDSVYLKDPEPQGEPQMIDVTKKFVVYVCERLRDGTEEWAKVVTGLPAAVEYANRMKHGVNQHNTDCLIFKLGEHVPLIERVVEVTQPSVTKTVYEVQPEAQG